MHRSNKGPVDVDTPKMTKNDLKLKSKLDETQRKGCEMTEEVMCQISFIFYNL